MGSKIKDESKGERDLVGDLRCSRLLDRPEDYVDDQVVGRNAHKSKNLSSLPH